jgi:hypothetical protein
MMSALHVLSEIRAHGLTIRPRGDGLFVGPRERITDGIRKLVAFHRDALLAYLWAGQPPPCPGDLAERVAVMVEGAGLTPSAAQRSALEEAGFDSLVSFSAGHRDWITATLDRLGPATTNEAVRLQKVMRAFLATSLFEQALAVGWSHVELFGVSPHAPFRRLAEQGLVSGLALSVLIKPRLETIAGEGAVIICGSGSRLIYRRGHRALDGAVPWWEQPQTTNRASQAEGSQP